jgi:hypothetical protein
MEVGEKKKKKKKEMKKKKTNKQYIFRVFVKNRFYVCLLPITPPHPSLWKSIFSDNPLRPKI